MAHSLGTPKKLFVSKILRKILAEPKTAAFRIVSTEKFIPRKEMYDVNLLGKVPSALTIMGIILQSAFYSFFFHGIGLCTSHSFHSLLPIHE